MARLFQYGFKVKWTDGRSELFRYDSEEEALRAREYQNIENWTANKWVGEVRPYFDWRGLFGFLGNGR